MKKTIISILTAITILSACGGSEEPSLTREEEVSGTVLWYTMYTDEEREKVCDVYFSVEKEEIIEFLISEPNSISEEEAYSFYNILNEEC